MEPATAASQWHPAKTDPPAWRGRYLVLEGDDLCPAIVDFVKKGDKLTFLGGKRGLEGLLDDIFQNFTFAPADGFYEGDFRLRDVEFWAEINFPEIHVTI